MEWHGNRGKEVQGRGQGRDWPELQQASCGRCQGTVEPVTSLCKAPAAQTTVNVLHCFVLGITLECDTQATRREGANGVRQAAAGRADAGGSVTCSESEGERPQQLGSQARPPKLCCSRVCLSCPVSCRVILFRMATRMDLHPSVAGVLMKCCCSRN